MIPLCEYFNAPVANCVVLKTDFKIDINALQNYFLKKVKTYNKTLQGGKKHHGGWSVQSDTGKISGGWQPGSAVYKLDAAGNRIRDLELEKRMFPNGHKFNTPTPLYEGPAKLIVDSLINAGYQSKRTRFSEIDARGEDNWHIDGSNNTPWWRGHFAIVTNPNALFRFKDADGNITSCQIPADGHFYLINVNLKHSIINNGAGPRTHLLVDSSNHITKFNVSVEPYLIL
jgi:hypothetical protein